MAIIRRGNIAKLDPAPAVLPQNLSLSVTAITAVLPSFPSPCSPLVCIYSCWRDCRTAEHLLWWHFRAGRYY